MVDIALKKKISGKKNLLGAQKNDVKTCIVLPGTPRSARWTHLKSWHLLQPIANSSFVCFIYQNVIPSKILSSNMIPCHLIYNANGPPITLSYRPISPTAYLWPLTWADLAQNLISSSTPGGATLYQVWWKSTQGFLRFRINEVKIAYLDQVHWPLTFGGSRQKSNKFIYSWWCTHVPSLMKIHPGVLEISR